MNRSRYGILAASLSLVVGGMLLHMKAAAGGKNESPVPKQPAVQSMLSGQPKQYGHVVLEDVRVNAMGVRCTIKRIRLLYKGDGIDMGTIGNVLANGEAELEKLPAVVASSAAQSMHFIMPEAKDPAELKRLADEDGKTEVKVVLWTYMNLDPHEEFIQADHRLAEKLAEEIRRLSDENKEKVTIVKPNRIEQYKSQHPDWKSLELTRVGHDFAADYVICLEIDELSLYEPHADQQIYRGKTDIQVSVVDMKNPDDRQDREFTDRYPGDARGDMTPFEMTPSAFRDRFLEHAAKRLAFYFVEHKKRNKTVDMDD